MLNVLMNKENTKEPKEIFGGDGYIQFLGYSDAITSICMCPNL